MFKIFDTSRLGIRSLSTNDSVFTSLIYVFMYDPEFLTLKLPFYTEPVKACLKNELDCRQLGVQNFNAHKM